MVLSRLKNNLSDQKLYAKTQCYIARQTIERLVLKVKLGMRSYHSLGKLTVELPDHSWIQTDQFITA